MNCFSKLHFWITNVWKCNGFLHNDRVSCNLTKLNYKLVLIIFVDSLQVSLYKIMSFANRNSFISSWMPFISCLITLAGTFSTVLNKSGESGHPCLVPDLGENASIIHT